MFNTNSSLLFLGNEVSFQKKKKELAKKKKNDIL